MGNGLYLKIFNCCGTKEDYHKGDIDIDKNCSGNSKTIEHLKRNSSGNKNEQNTIKTKSENSSKSGSLNKIKIGDEGGNPPPLPNNILIGFFHFSKNYKKLDKIMIILI